MANNLWEELHKVRPRSEQFPGEFICPRGKESFQDGLAVWQPDDSCSFCGSLHQDVFMSRLEAGDVELDPTDKDYKVYVRAVEHSTPFRQTYRGANDPGGNDPSRWTWTTRETRHCKFYFQHLTQDQRSRFIELLNADRLLFVAGSEGFYRLPFFIKILKDE